MQLQSDKSHRLEEIKTQFRAREGYYRLMNSPDYSQRSQRAMGFSTGTTNSNSSTTSNEKTCIKISLVTINEYNNDIVAGLQLPNSNSLKKPSSNSAGPSASRLHRRSRGARDKKICFNVGRELFVYNYDGVRTGPDASNPIYKRSYKGSSPTCHDFNQATATSASIPLLVGFSHGQLQLIDLNGSEDQEACKEFNVDRLIDKTQVTCVKWLPNSSSLFLVAHASGQLYLYKDDLPCGPAAPTYQLYKQSEGVTIYTCKTKTTRNPIYKWSIGVQSLGTNQPNSLGSSGSLHSIENDSCSLNEFAFSPCAKYLACVSQDGFLRVYCYDTMDLVGRARSYYGGLSCVCWSPDGKYVVTGGEDDLITVWSFVERRVVARGIGHRSWVSVVAFDSFYTGYDLKDTDVDNDDEEDEDDKEVDERDLEGEGEDDDEDDIRAYDVTRAHNRVGPLNRINRVANSSDQTKSPSIRGVSFTRNSENSPSVTPRNQVNRRDSSSPASTSYRFGSVGQDTQICLWDLTEDLLKQPRAKLKINSISGATSAVNLTGLSNNMHNNDGELSQNHLNQKLSENISRNDTSDNLGDVTTDLSNPKDNSVSSAVGFLSNKGSGFTKTFSLVGKRDKRNLSQRNSNKNQNSRNNSNILNNNSKRLVDDPNKLMGSPICPRMNEVPLLEPSVCKKIAFERLTSLIFCKGGFITSCQAGYVFSWARPSRRSLRISPGQSNEELRVIDVGTSSVV
ncbi:hypothetical protein SUGI_1493120 [Cryptomeria japonica]|uniref:WD repeat-containing protein 20 n=1 Tax=Cryptomeria japonica TaxID=3369 RepID=A0AAD3NUN0_CRYJA|nr:hypothetical protein SUGI_1493120 [Cryptomeria japonica]